MKLQKNKNKSVSIENHEHNENNVNLKELKEKAQTLELKIDAQNNRITKLLNSIEKMNEMNIQLVMTIEEMLYSIHHPCENVVNSVESINTEKEENNKIENWVKIN